MKSNSQVIQENQGGTLNRGLSIKPNFSAIWQKFGTFAILMLIVALLGILQPQYFLTTNNLTQAVLQSCITIIIALGEFFTILIAGIDLSIGAVMALSGLFTGQLLVAHFPVAIAIIIGILTGAVLGAINGFLVNKTGLHPFIITLGTQAIFRGMALVFSNANSVYGFPQSFKNVVAGWIGSVIPIPVVITFVLAIILWFVTNKTVLGRNIYALGGNAQSAWFSGININLHRLIVFTISGAAAGIAGVVMTAQLFSADPNAGTGYETFAIASAIIGGTSFFGGKGTIVGVVVGGLIIGVINNGLNILNVPTYYQQIVMGALIIGAVFLDKLLSQKK